MKKRNQLLNSLLASIWMIEPTSAQAYLPLSVKLLKGEKIDSDPAERGFALIDSASGISSEFEEMPDTVENDSVSVIPIIGPIMKYDSWCETGTQTRGQQLLEADANPKVRGHILLMDTPGGESGAVEILTNAMAKCTKPITVVADGLLCSAGMGIAAKAERIFLTTKMTIVGSIGTMITVADFSEYYKKEGIKLEDIYASRSTDKNREWRDALQGNNETMRSRLLDPVNEVFIAGIKEGRPGINEAAFTGRTYLASEAIAQGLADEMGDIKNAIDYIMFNKYKELDKFQGKQTLSVKEKAELQAYLQSKGIAATLAMPKSLLFDTDEDKDIYVYAEDGEDPVGKQCVYADESGNPTEENVADGDHTLTDGKIMTTSTKEEDGLSYVDSIKDAEAPTPEAEPPVESTSIELAVSSILEKVLAKVDEKFVELRSEISSDGAVPSGKGFVKVKPEQALQEPRVSAMKKRMEAITNKNRK